MNPRIPLLVLTALGIILFLGRASSAPGEGLDKKPVRRVAAGKDLEATEMRSVAPAPAFWARLQMASAVGKNLLN
ncbi:MAG TPA: hypothetical protein VKP58_10535 [Candidatus Acidoferrum sp.]|nr:hypothetical protein [Candidatus Acidoferrum sp.]